MPKKKGKKKRKKKKSSGQTKKNQVKIMSLGDIERRLLKTCAKAVTACDILLLNIKNHKEGLRVEDKTIADYRKLYMDTLTHKFLSDKDIEDINILQNALGRYMDLETFMSRAETTCMTCPLEVAPKLFYVPLREAFSSVYDILDQRATLCNRRLLGLIKFTDLWEVVFKEFSHLKEMAKGVFTKFLSYRILCQKYCGAGRVRPNHLMRMQKNWGGGRRKLMINYGALTKAVKEGNYRKCLHLLEKGSNPNEIEERSGAAPLHHASWVGNVAICELLLSRGALVNAQTHRGFTPLHFAYENHHYELISVLCTMGADQGIKSSLGTVPTQMKQARLHMHQIQKRIQAHEKNVKGEMLTTWATPVVNQKHKDVAGKAVEKFKRLVKSSGGPGGTEGSEHLPEITPETAKKAEGKEVPATDTPSTTTTRLPEQSTPESKVTAALQSTNRREAAGVTDTTERDQWSQLSEPPKGSLAAVDDSEVVIRIGDSGQKGVVGQPETR